MIQRNNLLIKLLVPIILIVIVTYPSSPVLIHLLFGNYKVYYVVLTIILILIIAVHRKRKLDFSKGVGKMQMMYFISVLVYLIAAFAVSGNVTAVRDVITLIAIFLFIFLLPDSVYLYVFRRMISLIVLIVSLSALSIIVYQLGVINADSWNVSQLNLNADNPLYTRHFEVRDFNYYHPMYLSVIPEHYGTIKTLYLFNLKFVRQPFIFTESTYTWAYLSPFFLACFFDQSLKRRKLFLVILGGALIISFANAGILLAVAIFGILLLRRILRLNRLLFVFLAIVGGYVLFANAEVILNVILPSKVNELKYFSDGIKFSSVAPFGNVGDEEYVGYGAISLLFRYGYIGFSLYLFWMVYFIVYAVKIDIYAKGNRFLGIGKYAFAIIFTSLIFLKIPQILLLPSLLLIKYVDVKIREQMRLKDEQENKVNVQIGN